MLSKSAQCGPHASAPDEIDKLPWIIVLVVEFLGAVSLVANVDQITFSHRKERSRSTAPSRLGRSTVSVVGGLEPGRAVSVVGFNVMPPVFRQNGHTGGDERVKIQLS
jgi:hypothetical protein